MRCGALPGRRNRHRGAMNRLLKPLWVLLALVFLFEAWLWDQLAPLVARLEAVR